jgi:hypothetical protein
MISETSYNIKNLSLAENSKYALPPIASFQNSKSVHTKQVPN